jgi:phenylalanyl-tRNA synthetase alpha chain
MKSFPSLQYQILQFLHAAGGRVSPEELAQQLKVPYPRIAGDCEALTEKGYLHTDAETRPSYFLGPKAQEDSWAGLPERAVAAVLDNAGGQLDLGEVTRATGLTPAEVGGSLAALLGKGWATKEGRSLVLADAGRAALRADPGEDERLLDFLRKRVPFVEKRGRLVRAAGYIEADQEHIEVAGIDFGEAMALLKGRRDLLRSKERTRRWASLTEAGRRLVRAGIEERKQVNLLTADLLKDGAWRDVEFRPYDVTIESAVVYPGKSHPLRRVLQAIRQALLEMGFTEVTSPLVESAFWCFDALFQPQDHPAREMQDTYYVSCPVSVRLPDNALVQSVGATHETGGETGSTGWGYAWEEARAAKAVLRTHTTASTIRALAAHPRPPGRYFAAGLVFRREAADIRHLCAFYQVDGIIVDEQGSLAALLGTLRTLYRRLGLREIGFSPDFFPYTEPSVEVRAWLPDKQQWLELCGAGVFRPEVTQPLGCTVPVLAWGSGLERLTMALYGFDDMRALYHTDMDLLRRTPLCPR